jgi:hypothetical protein
MKIDFEFTTPYGVFRDALYLDDDHQLTGDQINALKQERLDNWLFTIENPPAPPEIVEIDGVQYERVEINGQIVLKPVEAQTNG